MSGSILPRFALVQMIRKVGDSTANFPDLSRFVRELSHSSAQLSVPNPCRCGYPQQPSYAATGLAWGVEYAEDR